MNIIKISTQAEFDALPLSFSEFTQIQIVNTTTRITVATKRENSSVVAGENSSVVAWENSSVVARENSSVEAWGNSSVEAWGDSSVEAWGNSSVVAWENSSVVAWENSSVEAWENSSVEAWGNSGIHNQSELTSLILAGYSVVWLIKKAKSLVKNSKTVTVITPPPISTNEEWLDNQGVEIKDGKVILFKRVSSDFKTQEKTKNETNWTIGNLIEHSNYNPKTQECGEGKFHACSRPYFCDEFRNQKDDKYIAIEIKVEDLYCWPSASYPYKIAFRAGEILYQCDRKGNKI